MSGTPDTPEPGDGAEIPNERAIDADPGGPAALLVEHVVVRRGGTLILDDVSVCVERDERWIVLGANGSGKTTLLRIMALYDHPTSGHVEVLGQRLGRG